MLQMALQFIEPEQIQAKHDVICLQRCGGYKYKIKIESDATDPETILNLALEKAKAINKKHRMRGEPEHKIELIGYKGEKLDVTRPRNNKKKGRGKR